MLYPSDPQYPRGAKLAMLRLAYDKTDPYSNYGRALHGRLLYFFKMVPQRNSTTIEAVAWHRASGAQPGYWNRTQRKKRKYVDN